MTGTRKLLCVFIGCAFAGALTAQTYVGNLNGTSNNSTFEIGLVNVGNFDTDLSSVGWTEVSGDTRMFKGSSNIAVISASGSYDLYSLRFDTGVAVTANTNYSISLDLGFQTNNTGNTANYTIQVGTWNGSTFSPLGTAYSSSLSYSGGSGSLNIGSGLVFTDTANWSTGASVDGNNVAVLFSLDSYGANANSDFFGFDNVKLTVSAVPEPSTYAAILGLGALGLAAWRRRRTA